MSIRAISTKLFRHGQAYVRHICRRNINTSTITENINAAPQSVAPVGPNTHLVPRTFALRNVGVQVGLHARRILIDNVLNRVTNSLGAELRKKAARRILYGDSAPFFALVGVSLASGTGILTKEEELEGVCWEIREAISKIKWNFHDVNIDEQRFENEPVTLNELSIGQPIAKGANAVVYNAKLKTTEELSAEKSSNISAEASSTGISLKRSSKPMMSDKNITEKDNINEYPLAVKMMFNYDIQSNGMAILRAMYKETIPARLYYSNINVTDWELDLSKRKRHLPPHPNVVAMFSVFTDYIPELMDARRLYPAALPPRIYSEGDGRNMSLFLIMKRYNCSLQQFISSTPSIRTSVLLLAQLLEGVAHLAAHGIAHRDLKSDNLLMDTSDVHAPILVISDFGCCLADKTHSLSVNYTSYEVDKGGNTALMAPEIINQTPGTFSVLNYSKSDLWASGTIAYEIFGESNPFYNLKAGEKLMNTNYKEEQLPELRDEVPDIVKALIKNLLMRNPNKRLDPEVAANVSQLFLWAPSTWLKPEIVKLPTSAEILEWLLCLTTKVLCEGRLNNKSFTNEERRGASVYGISMPLNLNKSGRRTYTEYLLISSFLCRAKLSNIKAALNWIHNNI